MHARLRRAAAAVVLVLLGAGCEQLRQLSDADLELAYLADDAGVVRGASASTGTRVIASARRVRTRATERPEVTEFDVDETHYVRGSTEIVFTGRLVFRCVASQPECERIHEAPTSGTRPRDIFRRWPRHVAAGGRR